MDTFAIRGGKKVVIREIPHSVWPPRSVDDEFDELKMVRDKGLGRSYQETLNNQFQSLFLDYLDNKVRYSVITPGLSETVWAITNILDIGEGDEIICSPFADYALYDALCATGATVIIHECEKDTGCVTPELIAASITEHTKIIFVTHHRGNPINLQEIRQLLSSNSPLLVEDCSYAHGALVGGVHVGVQGDIGLFPLNYEKLIYTGQGTIMVTNNRLFIDCMKDCMKRGYQGFGGSEKNNTIGNTYLLSPLHAIVGKYSMRRVLHTRHGAKKCLEYLRQRLENVTYFSLVHSSDPGRTQGSWHGFVLQYDQEKLRKLPIAGVVTLLQAEGVEISLVEGSVIHTLSTRGEYEDHKATQLSKTLLIIPSFYDRYTHKDTIDQYVAAFRKVQLNLFC